MQVVTQNSGQLNEYQMVDKAYEYLHELVEADLMKDIEATKHFDILIGKLELMSTEEIDPEEFIYQFNKIEQLFVAEGSCEYFAPFSPVGLASIKHSDAFINLFEGAVRSGKTVASEIAWINFLHESPHREFLMTGKTADTLYRNVLDGRYGILNLMGGNATFKKSTEGGAKLFLNCDGIEKICYCLGANDERAEGNIRGMTIGGWYADEITLYPESFVKQGINRMSLDGARALWTMNPDSPYHYIKTEFIDQSLAKEYRVWHFVLDDNYALSKRYKEALKRAYSGLWYMRMVQGLWVMADGIIYNLFEEHMIVDEIPDMRMHWVALDYGTSNATVFLLCGLGVDGRFYVLDEWYHSGADGMAKSPSQYSQCFKEWTGNLTSSQGGRIVYEKIFADPSAEAFMTQLYVDGVRGVYGADNSVKTGIELVTNLMGNDHFRVHRKCKNVIRELNSYVWDTKAQKRGDDVPLKQNDHTMDAMRYCVMSTKHIWMRRAA